MNTSMSPPGTTEDVRTDSALVLAPHYDDEVLGCGGLLARLAAAGAAVRVLFLSDSGADALAGEERGAYSERRRQEAKEAAKVLGLAGADHLALPDGALEQHTEAIAGAVRSTLLSQRPELLLVPSPLESSSDHRAAFRALHDLLGGVRRGDPLWPVVADLEVLAYEVNHPLRPDLLVDVSDQVEAVERAMTCYPSQQERHDYLAARRGLSRFRTLTLPPEVEAAEAYRRLSFNDFQTRGPARLVTEFGGAPEVLAVDEGPPISVVVRTRDRPELLAEALASLAASTYRRAQVVVVNDGGRAPEIPAGFSLPIEVVNLETNRGRAAAANAGIAAAKGEYVTFLDDDDLAEPEHLATLAGLVRAAGVKVAYTDAAVGVYELDGETGWRCVERRLPYSRDFDPGLLRFDNYIPFNTLIVERRLLEEAGELDEDLQFFEDWDLLIRLAALTTFHHFARVTCEYRHFRGGGHQILGELGRSRADFLEMKARVIAKHADAGIAAAAARAVDRLRADCVAENEEVGRLRREREALRGEIEALRGEIEAMHDQVERAEERYHRLNGRLHSLETHQQVIEETERRAREDLRQREGEVLELKSHARELDETLRKTWAEIERLNALIRAMESTRAWRAHQWWQRRRP